jgi:biotin carboxyl carrier protein
MPKHFRITVDGRSYDVVVEELDQGAAPLDAWAATAVGPAAPPAAAAPVAVPPPVPAPAAPAPAGAGAIVAPLGGVVLSIDVRLGGEVAVGDKVAIIDAMKMKTEVVSKLAGKVTNIAAKVNESVETGQVLLTVG